MKDTNRPPLKPVCSRRDKNLYRCKILSERENHISILISLKFPLFGI